jgi:DNA-nicking Smr family endonuclease
MSRKKKSQSQSQSGDFRNEPFRDLRGLRSSAAARKERPPSPNVQQPGEEDAETLFLRAAGGARKIGSPDDDDGAPQAQEMSSVRPPEQDVEGEDEAFRRAMHMLGTRAFADDHREKDADDDDRRRSVSSRMRQLKKGTIRIADVLDLHGYLRDEAVRRLEHFIGSAYARSLPAVLVITGKGLNSPDGPVLQGAVREWLRTAGSRMVAEFHAGPRDKGGSGAYVVFLRRKT